MSGWTASARPARSRSSPACSSASARSTATTTSRGHMVAEGDIVVTEHVEQWRFHTGEVIDHPFTSVMEVRDGRITRWHDYSHLGNLIDNAPAWWLEHIAAGWR